MATHARINRHMSHMIWPILGKSSYKILIDFRVHQRLRMLEQLKSGKFFSKTREKNQQEIRIVWKSPLICAKKNGEFQISGLYVSPRCGDSNRLTSPSHASSQFTVGLVRSYQDRSVFSSNNYNFSDIIFNEKYFYDNDRWVIAIDRSSDRSSDLKIFFAPINMVLLKFSVLTYILC